ncbi:MAG: hypothetical protein BAJALOKI3v1_40057 [Promethearchaeota archaeon]|nr:MAG: hypothetical protein BAJALOKI3v1_40057 [Candidatus Lokiarchaeota archaeon]
MPRNYGKSRLEKKNKLNALKRLHNYNSRKSLFLNYNDTLKKKRKQKFIL